jgi:indole-3-glycerol phosphate synthase
MHTDFQEIVRRKRRLLRARKQEAPLQAVRAQAMLQTRPLDIASRLVNGCASVMAEVKRVLSNGEVVQRYDPVALAKRCEEGGASVLSVATDETVLHGDLAHLMHVKGAVSIPVLRHDFIFDSYQIFEARAAGADGVRLIARILSDGELRYFLSLTQRLKMTALIEVQTLSQLKRVLPLEPRLIGLNNRDWETGEVDFGITELLSGRIPPITAVVSGGGIRALADARRVAAAGVDAIFVGEALLEVKDPAAMLREWLLAIEHVKR